MPMGSIPSNVKSARFMCGSNPHHINRNADGLQYSSFGKIKENTQKQVASRYARLKAMG